METGAPRISAIIVTYDSAQTIASCLGCLKESLAGRDGEIIVVDNASGDDTREIVRGAGPECRLVEMPDNRGFAAGVNAGIARSRGRYVLLVNPDLFLNARCVDGMVEFLESREDAGAAGPALVYPGGGRQPSCRRYPTFRAVLSSQFPFLTKWIWKEILAHYLMSDTALSGPLEVVWLMGACILIRRDALEDVGVLDDGFFLYREDTDWCVRARNKGWKVFFLPGLEAVHQYARKSSKGMNRHLLWHLGSMLRFYRKHGFRF